MSCERGRFDSRGHDALWRLLERVCVLMVQRLFRLLLHAQRRRPLGWPGLLALRKV